MAADLQTSAERSGRNLTKVSVKIKTFLVGRSRNKHCVMRGWRRFQLSQEGGCNNIKTNVPSDDDYPLLYETAVPVATDITGTLCTCRYKL